MNSYGHPQHPEVAMLEELHSLWDRVLGGERARPRRGMSALMIAGVVMVLAGVAASLL